MVEEPGPTARLLPHPIVSGPPDVTEGYLRAFEKELAAMRYASQQHQELVERWQRLLTLHRKAMIGTNAFKGAPDSAERTSEELRARLIGLSGGTSKLALDAALFGYYSSSFGLTRHMLESWAHASYVEFFPEEAKSWFMQQSGTGKSSGTGRERSSSHVLNKLNTHFRKHYPDDLFLVERTQDVHRAMHKGAHPSGHLLDQMATNQEGRFIYGPNYRADLALVALSCGVWATLMITREAHRIRPQDEPWQREIRRIQAEHKTVIPDFTEASKSGAIEIGSSGTDWTDRSG